MSEQISNRPAVDVEAVLAREMGTEGGLSRYQIRAVTLCFLASMFSSFSTNEYVFTTGRTPTRCFIPECENTTEHREFHPMWIGNAIPNTSTGFDNCQRFANAPSDGLYRDDICPATLFDPETTITCERYVYKNMNTAVYTLGLACDEWRRSLLGSARTLGAFLSLPIAGVISDRWGRRTALVITLFSTACMGILRIWASTYAGFITSVFAEASLGAGAILACAYVLGVETVPMKYRIATGTIVNSSSSVGQVILGLLAWAIPDWRYLTLALYAPQLLTLLYIWVLPESLRWYLSKGRYAEAESALQEMAKVNKVELSAKTLVELKEAAEYEKAKSEEKDDSGEPWLIVVVFQYKAILLRVLTAPVWWITVMLTYYGLSVNAVNISGNMYLNFVFVAMVDIPGFWTSVLLVDRVGRKPVIIAGFWICAVCQVSYIFMPKGQYLLSLAVYLLGKFCIAMVGTSIYVYTSELYPTQYRHRLFGYTSMMGRIGSIVAPLTPALGAMVWEQLPFALFAGMALLSGLLVMMLPETKGCRLPDTMQEAADIGKQRKNLQNGRDNQTYQI